MNDASKSPSKLPSKLPSLPLRLVGNIFAQVQNFLRTEASGGVILLICTMLAIFIANSSWVTTYQSTLAIKLGPLSLLGWINDGLMALFFFVVGMEIKHELIDGALASVERAALPAIAALGGMVAPAIVFMMINQTPDASHGWGVPMATDIAFAVGVMALLGSRVPQQLKIFLLALAIVDDLGAILVIAIFYSSGVSLAFLAAAFAVGVLIFGLLRKRVLAPFIHIPLGLLVWFLVHESGVHATIAGCALGLMMPHDDFDPSDPTPLERWVGRLHPLVAFFIMPVFALANAGMDLSQFNMATLMSNDVVSAISYGLLIGKPLGIILAAWLAVKLGIAKLSPEVNWGQFAAMGCLAGIGFTMALFISQLAFSRPEILELAKMGIVKGSVLSALIGLVALAWFTRTPQTSNKN